MTNDSLFGAAFHTQIAGIGVELSDTQVAKLARLLEILGASNRYASLTSGGALADAVRTHILDSLTLVPQILERLPRGGSFVDVGTGGGFPGVVLKIAAPELDTVLIEAAGKKASYLARASDELGLGLHVLHARAETVAHDPAFRGHFDVATARAIGGFPLVLELTLPLCKTGGVVLAQRGSDGPEEAESNGGVARLLGGEILSIEQVGLEFGLNARHLVVVQKVGDAPDRYPRKAGIPAKRPLRVG